MSEFLKKSKNFYRKTKYQLILILPVNEVLPTHLMQKHLVLLFLLYLRKLHFLIYFDKKQNLDRKSTRLNSSHANISYAVFCLKNKTTGPTSCASGRTPPTATLTPPSSRSSSRSPATAASDTRTGTATPSSTS